jgi:hypothetical protein
MAQRGRPGPAHHGPCMPWGVPRCSQPEPAESGDRSACVLAMRGGHYVLALAMLHSSRVGGGEILP